MTDTAVVILNYNGRELLRRFLPSVVKHSGSARIVVVDNASADDSLEFVAKEFPQVERIRIDENRGFCGGYNASLKQIQADRYVLVNSDVEVTAGWLDPLGNILDLYPDVAAVQPKILSEKQKTHFEYAGAGGGLIDTLGYPFCRGRLFYHLEADQGQYNDERQIFWSSGACMMIRSKLFHELEGFDEDFFAHMEEIDLCWRLQRAGHRIFYTGASTVYHVGGGTLSASNPRKTYLNFKNGLSLLYKNLPRHELTYKFPIRIVLDWIASFKFAVSGTFRDSAAVLRAHAHFFGRYPRELARRKRFSKLGYGTLPSQYKGSIVWDFFILGKRITRQLQDKD